MIRFSLISGVLLSSAFLASANPAPEPAPTISPVTNGFNLDWDATNGNTYFVEYSYDLITWQYMPIIKLGTGVPEGYGFSSPDSKMFLRLRFTDVATTDPMTDDFDGDGISNWNEVRIGGTGTNPFMWDTDGDGKSDYYADSNGNGMSDGWETLYGNISDLAPNGNSDDDSWSNLKESLAGSNPLLGDTDKDNIKDDAESIWWDKRIEWPSNPEPQYVVVELNGLTLDSNKYGNGVAPDTFIQSADGSTQDDWIIKSLSNAGHVLVVEDKRGSAGSNNHLNPTTIPNSVINHVWVPSSQSWVTLKNAQVVSTNTTTKNKTFHTALAVANAVSKNGKIGGFAWVPLGKMENGTLVATGGAGVERGAILWGAVDEVTVPITLTSYEGLPFTSFSSDNDILEAPYNAQLNGISDTGDPLYSLSKANGVSLLLGTTTVADPASFQGFADYSITSQGDTFYSDWSSYGLVIKEAGANTISTIDDGNNRPDKFTVATRAIHTQSNMDMIGLSPELWIRDASTWKKVKKHPLHGFIKGKGISNEGVILGLDGKSIMANGQVFQIKDLVASTGWSDFKMAKMNDGGMMAGRATKGGSEKIVLLVPMSIVPDYNRDGRIDSRDKGKVTVDNPWRFWVNDDLDIWSEERRSSGDDSPGVSGWIRNNETPDVDGVRDLLDFFPLHIDLKSALKIFPVSKYKYTVKQVDSAVKYYEFPEVDLKGLDETKAPHTHLRNITYARAHRRQTLIKMTTVGQELSSAFLQQTEEGKGIILCEGIKNTTKPIILEIKKTDGTSVAKIEFPLSLTSVTDMYRTKYFISNDPEGDNGSSYAMPQSPPNWPDVDRNGKHFIFIHGYNVNRVQSSGWFAEMFKRLYWSGSDAMFTGISWEGYESQFLGNTPDYWKNVINAFQTSEDVAGFVNQLSGFKSIAAHSLGNMVVSSAITDHNLAVYKYFMIDAAVPIEAYQDAEENYMRPYSWSGYASRLWPTEWHKLFKPPLTDARYKLTWRMRFENFQNAYFQNAYNCYSWGEEVLSNSFGGIPPVGATIFNHGLRSWAYQEMTKGDNYLSGGGAFHDAHGGWDFNESWKVHTVFQYDPVYLDGYVLMSPTATTNITDAQLKLAPFFKPFKNTTITDPILGNAEADKYEVRANILAEAMPAYSFAAGANPMSSFTNPISDRNISMMTQGRTDPNEWPPDGIHENHRDWLHSDIRDVGYLHTYKIYDFFVEKALLK